MKYTVPLTLLVAAISVDAAAISEESKRWCSTTGQACDTVKRAADAFADALSTAHETAYIARRQLNELAFAVAATRRDPAAFYNGLSYGNSVSEREAGTQEGNWCTLLPGQPCWKRNEQSPALEVAKRDAEAQNGNWCTVLPGQPCWKRNASVEERRNADPFCSQFVGESCYKRDETPAVAEQYKRCVSEGQPCWHAKRIASAVVNAIDAGNAQRMKREVTQEWAKRAPAADAACNAADSACHLAARDLHAVYNVARTNLEA